MHVRTCLPLLRISGTAGRILLKFGVVMDQLAMHLIYEQRMGYLRLRISVSPKKKKKHFVRASCPSKARLKSMAKTH